MKSKFKYILANFCLLIASLFLISNHTWAQIEFETASEIIYQVGPRGNGSVTQEISLTNNFSHIYPREYRLQITKNNLQNIVAEDSEGSILSHVEAEGESTVISLKFNEVNVGKGKQLDFFIQYDMPNLANKRGQIWEMAIPRLANIEQFADLELQVIVPSSFGSLSYSSINPRSQTKDGNNLKLIFEKNQISQNPILMAFGEFQIFDFDLDFTLINQNNQPTSKSIPVPPDTSYQSITLTDINPQPIKIYKDTDYNWLALYQLGPGERIDIKVKGQAKIFSGPENQDFTQLYKNKSLNAYLKEDIFWEVNSPIIQTLAENINTPKQIYDFVVDHLEYNYEEIKKAERIGAVAAYQRGTGVCTEFSDLFVTLARANNIPARELQGFAFTEDRELFSLAAESDVLHSWVEYWDSNNKVWTPADPTWGKTTRGIDFISQFDLGHFVFVIHGQSSTEPIPPGFYKAANREEKSITVDFGEKLIATPKENLTAKLIENNGELKIKITNPNLSPIYKTELSLSGWDKNTPQNLTIDLLPPLGEKTIAIGQPSFWKKIFSKPVYNVSVNQEDFKLEYPGKILNLISFFVNLWPL